MPKEKINKKTISRLAAVQLAYLSDGDNFDPELAAAGVLGLYRDQAFTEDFGEKEFLKIKLSESYFRKLVDNFLTHKKDIDSVIEKFLSREEKLKTLNPATSAILRIGAAELLYMEETPVKVSIDEFTSIASQTLGDSEIGFVNSLLDKIGARRATG